MYVLIPLGIFFGALQTAIFVSAHTHALILPCFSKYKTTLVTNDRNVVETRKMWWNHDSTTFFVLLFLSQNTRLFVMIQPYNMQLNTVWVCMVTSSVMYLKHQYSLCSVVVLCEYVSVHGGMWVRVWVCACVCVCGCLFVCICLWERVRKRRLDNFPACAVSVENSLCIHAYNMERPVFQHVHDLQLVQYCAMWACQCAWRHVCARMCVCACVCMCVHVRACETHRHNRVLEFYRMWDI